MYADTQKEKIIRKKPAPYLICKISFICFTKTSLLSPIPM